MGDASESCSSPSIDYEINNIDNCGYVDYDNYYHHHHNDNNNNYQTTTTTIEFACYSSESWACNTINNRENGACCTCWRGSTICSDLDRHSAVDLLFSYSFFMVFSFIFLIFFFVLRTSIL